MKVLSYLRVVPSYLRVGLTTTWNIVLYAVTFGNYIWLEGGVSRGRGVFRNWIKHFPYTPKRFAQPSTEEEIVELIRNSRSLRVYGAGHSFNSGIVSDGTLVSLDKYKGLVCRYPDKKQIAIRGGTRIREAVKLLSDEGLAFRALPSHDAQSLAGILSTDVHGTGRIFGPKERQWGFVSQSVVGLKLIDGKGEIHECGPSDDLFKAAVGGIGAVGIITEVTIQGVPRFNIEQKVERRDVSYVEENLEQLLRDNDHLSLYFFPFSDKCQVNIWNNREKAQTIIGRFREFIETNIGRFQEFVNISRDALAAAWVGNLYAYIGRLPQADLDFGFIRRDSDLVLESNKGFNRSIYHQHQELEFTVPFEDTFPCCKRFKELYERLYPSGLPYALFEVRFTPDKHDCTLIGPGRDRLSTWIDLVCNDSLGYEKFYAEAEELMKTIGARPHLGKFCESFSKADMERLHGDSFTKFLNLVEEHDPEGKFANDFTRRLFGDRA
jgi:FAD/FMN-containing dehydrogenase